MPTGSGRPEIRSLLFSGMLSQSKECRQIFCIWVPAEQLPWVVLVAGAPKACHSPERRTRHA